MAKNKKYSRVMSMILALVLVFTSVLPANAAGALPAETKAVQEGTSDDPNAYAIYPIPQSITYAGGGFALSDEVAVVAEEGVDEYTVAFLERILKEYDVTYTKESEVQAGKSNIRLCVQDSASLKDPALFEKTDAYMLDANNGMIVISGKDADSVYYGVATLQMMFSSFMGEKFLNAHIEDFASVAKRGYIEGFYGAWSFEEREDLMRFAGNYKMNSYVYAAKGDAYHTSKWAELYPADMLAQFENLVKVGEETKVKFGWSVHLGNFFKTLTDANYEELYAKLLAKIDQLRSVGIEKFDVLNDDFGGGSHETVVAVLNRLNKDLKDRGCEPLVYCPQGYNVAWSGNGAELAALRNLDSDITIYWTGADVNSPITQESVSFLEERTNHKPDFWLNYPVNEHGKSGIYLGDITHYARDGVSGMAGFHSNPSRFAYANEVGLYQLAALVWNNNDYSAKAEEIWLSAFDYLQPEVEDAYRLIARNVSNCPGSGRVPQGFHESEYLAEKLNTVQRLITSGASLKDSQETQEILAEFEAMIAAVAEFRANCANPGLWIISIRG